LNTGRIDWPSFNLSFYTLESENILPQNSNVMKRINKYLLETEEYVNYFDKQLPANSTCIIEATVYYSYSSMSAEGSDISRQATRQQRMAIRALNSNFPNYQIGGKEIELPNETLIKKIVNEIMALKNKYPEAKNKEEDFNKLTSELIDLAYRKESTYSEYFIYFPFISAHEVVQSIDLDLYNWFERLTIKPLKSTVSKRIVSKRTVS
jgi:hypothetical protein